MSGTKFGATKATAKILARNPNFFKRIGAIGGKKGTGHEYGHGMVDPRINGSLGGKKSRKGYKLIDETATTYTYTHKVTGKLLKISKGE